MRKTTITCLPILLALHALTGIIHAGQIGHYTLEVKPTTGGDFRGGTFTQRGNRLVYFLSLYGRGARPEIHGPAAPGADAPLIFTLNESSGAADELPLSVGEVVLSTEEISQLASGLWYVSVDGADRRQIVPNAKCRGTLSEPIFLSANFSDQADARASFWLNGTLLDWEIDLPTSDPSYKASIFQKRSWSYRGGLMAYIGSLDCTNSSPCVTRSQICLREDLIPQLLAGIWSLTIWNDNGFSLGGTIAPPDSDHDGVPDYRDKCSDTPANVAINSDGCSIDQLCPCEGSWRNHSEYVKCVRSATATFVTNGIITASQAERAVRLATTHDCGKQNGALFPLAVPFAPIPEIPGGAWSCGYWDVKLEISGTNQVPPVETIFSIFALVLIDFCLTTTNEFPTAGDIRIYMTMSPHWVGYSVAIYGPSARDGPDVNLFDVMPCEDWNGDYCVHLTDAQLRDAFNGRYSLYVLSDAFPGGFLRARISTSDGDGDGVSDFLDDCPNTPPRAIVNEHGCRIEDVCPCNAQWINRGEYMSCVQSAADNLLKSAIITASEKQRIIKQARDSNCGIH